MRFELTLEELITLNVVYSERRRWYATLVEIRQLPEIPEPTYV